MLPEFKFDFKPIELDLPRYNKTLDRVLGQIIREAAREWLRSVLKNNPPVETGMAKSTLVPLGRFLNKVGNLGFTPQRKPYFTKFEGEISPEAGEEKSKFYLRDDRSHPLSFVYEFEWSTDVLHYWIREFYNGSPAGEELLDEAEQNFLDHIERTIDKRLPHYADFLK